MASPDFGMSPVAAAGRKPKTSIYTILLIVALMALLVGIGLLYAEIRFHGGFGTVRGRVSLNTPSTSVEFSPALVC